MADEKDLDKLDRDILRLLASDASLSLADIASKVGLTATPCWKRIRRMEQEGVIRGRVATIDPAKVGLPVSVCFVAADNHGPLGRLVEAICRGRGRDAGDRRCVADEQATSTLSMHRRGVRYRRTRRISIVKLIAAVPLRNVTSRFSMERLKEGPLPL